MISEPDSDQPMHRSDLI